MIYSRREQNDMLLNTGAVPSIQKYNINLIEYPNRDAINKRKIVLGNMLAQTLKDGRVLAANIRMKLVESFWSTKTKNEMLTKCRLEVEKQMIDDEGKLSMDDLSKLLNTRREANRVQRFGEFEAGLLREIREKLGLNFRDEKDKDMTPQDLSEDDIKKIMVDRLKAYHRNEFHYEYDHPENRRPRPVETIGV